MSYARRKAIQERPAEMQAATDKAGARMRLIHKARISGKMVPATLEQVPECNRATQQEEIRRQAMRNPAERIVFKCDICAREYIPVMQVDH